MKKSLLAKILSSNDSDESEKKKEDKCQEENCCNETLCSCELDEEYPTACNDEAGCCCGH